MQTNSKNKNHKNCKAGNKTGARKNYTKNRPPYGKGSYGRGNKQQRREEAADDTVWNMSKSNPIEFYNKYTQFAQDASRIPFALPLGAPYTVKTQSNSTQHVIPGVMRLSFAPTVGISNSNESPMNRSSINYYAGLRSRQKAFGDYDHQDVTMMLLAIDSACMFHALGRRLYGIMRDMTPVNEYYPRVLVAAHNLVFSQTQKELQDFRAWLNEFALRIEQYTLPDDIALIKRHQWMCEGLYTDSESSRAQTYLFVPTGFWRYNNTVTTGSQLEWVQFSKPDSANVQLTVEQFEAIGDSLINAISNEADFALISGDLTAYYEGSPTLKLPYVTEDYTILPSYDKVVLSQIENAMIVGDWAADYTPVISQNPAVNGGAILFSPITKGAPYNHVLSTYMNMRMESPSSDEVMEATRLMVDWEENDVIEPEIKVTFTLKAIASEILQWIDVYRYNPANLNAAQHISITDNTRYFDQGDTEAQEANLIEELILLNKFDWAPQVHYFHLDAINTILYLGSSWDTDNFTPIDAKYLSTIHSAALYSLFNAKS